MLLEGRGQGAFAPIYARATLLDIQRGRPTLAPELLVEVMHRMRRGEEALDIALVAQDAALALTVPLPRGLNVIAVIAEQSADGLNPAVPLVGGIVDAPHRINDGDFVIVDSGRGRVIVNPTAEQIALLQTEAFRPRVLVGQASTPALTRSGRQVKVWALVGSAWEAEAAVAEGADGLVLTSDGPLASELTFADDWAVPLAPLVQSIGGGDIALDLPLDTLDIDAVVRLAARCRLTLLLDPRQLPAPLLDLRQEMADAAEAAAENDEAAQVPLVGAVTDDPDYSMAEFANIFLPPTPDLLDPALLLGLPPAYLMTTLVLDSLRSLFLSEEEEGSRLPPLAGVVILPDQVEAWKDFIRTCE